VSQNLDANKATERYDLPDMDGVRRKLEKRKLEKAATAGNTDAMYNLGLLLATQLNPPDIMAGARRWLEKAATAGHTEAMRNLAYLLSDHTNPPDEKIPVR
jgi:TPR repeat protein